MLPKHASTPLVWLLTAAAACFISIACATEQGSEQKESESAQKSEKPAEPAEQQVKVYTNQDLEKMFGEEESAEPVGQAADEAAVERQPVMEIKVEPEPAEKPAGDPLGVMRQKQAEAEERSRMIAEAEQKVADAGARITQLEKRILALRNPYSARPEIPEDEKADWDSMGTRERLEKSEEQLKRAREELAAAEKELAGIR